MRRHLVLLLAAAAARADEVVDVANAVVEATKAGDKRLKAIAAVENPDPWIVGSKGAAEALREAQRLVREFRAPSGEHPYAHPYYWAAWVLWGLPE